MRRWVLFFMLFLAAREAADATEPMPPTQSARSSPLDEPAAARFAGKDPAQIAHDLLNRDASPETLAAIEKGLGGKPASPAKTVGWVIGSPDFQRR